MLDLELMMSTRYMNTEKHYFYYRDCLVTSLVNSLTSFFSGFVIFTYLGYMAKYQDREIDKVAEQGDSKTTKLNCTIQL